MKSVPARLVALLGATTLALLAACGFLLWRLVAGGGALNTQALLADPAIRDELVRRMATRSVGEWDTHNDPEVGRVLQPNLTRIVTGVPTQSNAFGLRERAFAMPKPPGTLRVVLLGDSYVQGYGVEAQDRLGAFLERYLSERAQGWSGPIECLHVAVGGWNTVSECAWLRRTFSDLAPDLVIHVLCTNDIDEHMGTRGFGALASFSPLTPERTDALVSGTFPIQFSSPANGNHLLSALDHESREHYQALARAIERVVPVLRRSDTPYLVLAHWGWHSKLLWDFLAPVLRPDEFAILPNRLFTQADLRHAPSDMHWTRAGHELVARLSFALIRQRDLLPELRLAPWPEIEEPGLAELAGAREDAFGERAERMRAPPRDLVSVLVPARFTDREWSQVYTGLDDEAHVSPFASFMLQRTRAHRAVRLRGLALPRTELAGARVRVSVEGSAVGELELVPGEAFDVRFELPLPRRFSAVSVRLETSDYVYTGRYLQHCVSFQLAALGLE